MTSDMPKIQDLDCYLEGDYQPPLLCGLDNCGKLLMFCDAGTSLNDMIAAAQEHLQEGCRGRGA
jgi:hypothetical protein